MLDHLEGRIQFVLSIGLGFVSRLIAEHSNRVKNVSAILCYETLCNKIVDFIFEVTA